MNQARRVEDLLEVAQWHVSRADGQRTGIWARSSALLTANSLVIAGSAILVSSGGDSLPVLVVGILPLGSALISVYFASVLVRSGVASERALLQGITKRPSAYSLTDLAAESESYGRFREEAMSKSLETELEDALVEIWRLSVLQGRRMNQLAKSLRWFLVGSALLLVAALAVLVARSA